MTHMELTWNRGPNLIVRVSMKDDEAYDGGGYDDVNGNNEDIADKEDDEEEEDEDNLRKGRL